MKIKYSSEWLIETPDGYKDFHGIAELPEPLPYLTFVFEDDSKLNVTYNHLFLQEGKEVKSHTLVEGEFLDTKDSTKIIKQILPSKNKDMCYDFLEVESKDNTYIANGIISHNCKFLGSTQTLIDPELLERIHTKDAMDTKYGGLMKIWEQPVDGVHYILGVDSSKGVGGDYSVIQVLKINTERDIEQVGIYRYNQIDTYNFSQICIEISQFYNSAYLMIENNAEGGEVANTIWYNFEYDYIINTDKKGIGTRSTKKSKLSANITIKRYLENGWLQLNDRDTVFELSRYEEQRPGVFNSGRWENDDCVTSLLWGIYYLTTVFFDGKNINVHQIDNKFKINHDEELPGFVIDDGTDLDGNFKF